MVAAFTCHEAGRYNQFVRGHRAELQRSDARLRDFFYKRGRGEEGYNSYKTDLANNSAVSSARAGSFCSEANAKFDSLRSARHLDGYTNASLVGYGVCPGVHTAALETHERYADDRSYSSRPQRARPVRAAYRDRGYDRDAGSYADDRYAYLPPADDERDARYAHGPYDDRYDYDSDGRYERSYAPRYYQIDPYDR
jgi:hypothetical protein